MGLGQVLARSVAAMPGYAGVGTTRAAVLDGAALPAGWHHLCHTAPVGRGPADLDVAGECIRGWGMQRGVGFAVAATADRADVGVTVVVGIGAGPLRVAAPCRVLWVVDSPTVRGFGYGTLAGHPETGEEAFVARLDPDGVVRATVLAFSRGSGPLLRAAGPVGRVAQRVAARAYVGAVRRAVRKAVAQGG